MEDRFNKVISAIDEINSTDPHSNVDSEGKSFPKELLYSHRMTEMLSEYDPNASELLKIAARGQHIKRWSIPRSDYEMDRKGYLQWRTQAKIMHAELVGRIMQENGYDEESIGLVQTLIKKTKLKTDLQSKQLEDVVCLVFLKYYYHEFIQDHEEEKIIGILQKTWNKMTEKGHEMALRINFTPQGEDYIQKALY